MYTLKVKTKKTKPPFTKEWRACHAGTDTSLSKEVQLQSMEIAGSKLIELGRELEKLGYDSTTIKFQINEKKTR